MKTFDVPTTHPRVAHWKPYYINNSLKGIEQAVEGNYKYIDQDCQVTLDGVIVVEHWAKPKDNGFTHVVVGHDKKGKEILKPDPNPDKTIGWRTFREVSNLRRADGTHRIRSARQHLKWCHDRGIIPCFEMKSNKFINPEVWTPVVKLADRLNASFLAMTLSTMPYPFRKLAAAKSKGIPTVLLNHDGKAYRTTHTVKIAETTTAVWG